MNDLGIKRLMADYNHFNEREVKAEIFFRQNVDQVEDKHIKGYLDIIHNLSVLQHKIESLLGRNMTDDEIFKGFKLE